MEQALIAIVGAVVGILLTNGLRLVLDARERRTRARDIEVALRAEIRSHRRALELFVTTDYADEAMEAIVRGGDVPFAPRKAEPAIFNAVTPQIHIVAGEVIDAVVLYYGQYASLRSFLDEMRSPEFAALASDRKAAAFRDYLRVGRVALDLADDAIDRIGAALGDRNGAQ